MRDTLEEIASFGDGGRQPGQFYGVHSIASNSKGNFYTTETYEGKRVQKFVYKGIGSIPPGTRACLRRSDSFHSARMPALQATSCHFWIRAMSARGSQADLRQLLDHVRLPPKADVPKQTARSPLCADCVVKVFLHR